MSTQINLKENKVEKLKDFVDLLNLRAPEHKLDWLESFVDLYKEQRDARTKSENGIQSKKDDLEHKELVLKEIGDLKIVLERINHNLEKFEKLKLADETINLEEKLDQIKKNRRVKTQRILHSFNQSKGNLVKVEASKDSFTAKFLFIPIAIIPFVTMFTYFTTNNSTSIVVGVLVMVLNILFWLGINFIESIKTVTPKTLLPSFGPNFSFEDFKNQFDMNEDKLLVNSAWIKALELEKQRINEIIKKRTNGLDMAEFMNQVSNLRKDVEDIIIDSAVSISAEDYLSARRELDIAKIEAGSGESNKSASLEISNIQNLDDDVKGLIMKYIDKIKSSHDVQVT